MAHLIYTLVGLFALYMCGVIFWALRWWLLGIAAWLAVGAFVDTQHIVVWNDYLAVSILAPFALAMVAALGGWAWDAIQWLRGTDEQVPAITRSPVEPSMMDTLRARGPLHKYDRAGEKVAFTHSIKVPKEGASLGQEFPQRDRVTIPAGFDEDAGELSLRSRPLKGDYCLMNQDINWKRALRRQLNSLVREAWLEFAFNARLRKAWASACSSEQQHQEDERTAEVEAGTRPDKEAFTSDICSCLSG
jgi:hypothetical protein